MTATLVSENIDSFSRVRYHFRQSKGVSDLRNTAWRSPAMYAALLLPLVLLEASAQSSGNWTRQIPQKFPQVPGSLTYDPAHSQVVMYSGANDIWLWDGSNWTQKFPQNNPPLGGSTPMVYDAARGQVVLFAGGNNMWVWDGTNWAQKFPQTVPSPRYTPALAYDSGRRQIVMFGGYLHSGFGNETWIWDGTDWTQKSTPAGLTAKRSAMAYDSAHGQVILFGGVSITSGTAIADTWVWDGATWTQKSTSVSPSPRFDAAMAYDTGRGQIILFGGQSTFGTNLNDTWAWDGSRWTQQFPQSSPPARNTASVAFDSARGQIVMFGGSTGPTNLTDTWTWTGANTGSPQPAIDHVITAGAYGAFTDAAPGSWIEIYGFNLAGTTRTWTGADFTGNAAPTSLDGVQVTIGGQKAAVYYIQSNPAQVSAQVPSNIASGGSAQLTVTNGGVTSAPINLPVKATEPGLLAPPSFMIGGKQYVVALLPDNATYVLPPGAIPGLPARQARPGDTITMYGVGFGSVSPSFLAGQIVTASNQLAQSFQVLFGQTSAQVSYAGLTPGSIGLYQFNVVVPGVADSDLVPLTFNLGGVAGTQVLYIAVHR